MQSCRLDQSAYVSYLVEEAVKQSDNSNVPPSQASHTPASSTSFTTQYPVEFIYPRNAGVPNFTPISNASFNPHLDLSSQTQQLYIVPSQQNTLQNPGLISASPAYNQEHPASFGLQTNCLQGQQSQTTVNPPRYHDSSFSLNQHIGLDDRPVVNASQINNRIQVQFQFGDNDRFSVQSTNATQSNEPGLNWQNFGCNVSEKQTGAVDLNIPTVVHPGNVQNNDNYLSPSPADFGDYSQFCVSNILKKNCTNKGNTKTNNGAIVSVENERDSQAEAKEYFRLFMQKEKEKVQKHIYDKSLLKYKPKTKKVSKTLVKTGDNNAKTSIINHSKTVNSKKVANEVKTAADIQGDDNGNRHAASNTYFKEYTELVKKQKAQRNTKNSQQSAASSLKTNITKVNVKKRSNASSKKSRSKVNKKSDQITLLKLTYQCGDCPQTYDNIGDLQQHIREKHSDIEEPGEGPSKCQEKESVIDLTESENLGESNMACETEEHELMEVESENTSSESQSFLCAHCGHDSKSQSESEEHQNVHKDEVEVEKVDTVSHKEEREYLQMSQELECQRKRETEKRKDMEEESERKEMEEEAERKQKGERERKEMKKETIAKAKADKEVTHQKKQGCPLGPKSRKVFEKKKAASNLVQGSPQKLDENRTLQKRKAATQAKNSLMNPSKGKQKRVRDTRNFNKEDTMLMEMFGIIPSNVCLSRVQESENLESKIVNNSSVELSNVTASNCERKSKGEEKQVTKSNKLEKNQWNKVISMSNSADENMNDDKEFGEDDSDIEIVEPPLTLIVLDDEGEEAYTKKESPKKSDEEILTSDELKDVTTNIDKTEKNKEIQSESKGKHRSLSDTELLMKFGIKDLSVSLTNTPKKAKLTKPGPKSKTQQNKRPAREVKSTDNAEAKNIEEMSPKEIEKLLYECGMGISVPVQSQSTSCGGKNTPDKSNRTPSPVPSTSKGHGHLKRKRTARKSTKDSALFKKYKLKDSKVIIENLSRIDRSLIRNPNSPFGKSDWLKHKFDSDTESDFEFDIPTPPQLEDFVENTGSGGDINEQIALSPRLGSPGKAGRKSPVKRKDLLVMEKFGISDSVVVINSPKKKDNSKAFVPAKKKTLSDDELRKKFGIPNTMVVIKTPEKTPGSSKKESCDKPAAEKTPGYINFDDFKSALDSARKSILSRMKSEDNFADIEKGAEIESPRKTRRAVDTETKMIQSPKRPKVKVTGKNVEQKDNKNDTSKEKKTEPQMIRRNQRLSSQRNESPLKQMVPNKLKTLTVDPHLLKLNEARKTYKAKAVSRAIEARHKKNRNLKELNEDSNEQNNTDNKKSPSSSRKRSRDKEQDILSDMSVKRKCTDISKKLKGTKQLEFKREIQIVKTARYKRSVGDEETAGTHVKTSDLKHLTKGLPVVKVTVPCLTSEEILRLSQNIEETNVSANKSDVDWTPFKVASQIIDEIIEEICSSDANDKINVKGGAVLSNSGKISVQESSDKQENDSNKNEESLKEAISADESESDLSLISCTSENKENENISTTPCHENTDISADIESTNDKNGNEIVEIEKTSVSEIDVIPLGKSKFFDEDGKDNSYDVVDGDVEDDDDVKDGTEMSIEDDEGIGQKVFDEKENDSCEINSNHEDVSPSKERLNDEIEHNVLQSCHRKLLKTGRKTDVINDGIKADDAIAEKENRNEKENNFIEGQVVKKVDKQLNDTEFANSLNSGVEGDVNEHKDCNSVVGKRKQILSAIIDSESGSLIGDVYSVDESAGSSGEGDCDKRGCKNGENSSESKVETFFAAVRSRSTTPDDIIETVTES